MDPFVIYDDRYSSLREGLSEGIRAKRIQHLDKIIQVPSLYACIYVGY